MALNTAPWFSWEEHGPIRVPTDYSTLDQAPAEDFTDELLDRLSSFEVLVGPDTESDSRNFERATESAALRVTVQVALCGDLSLALHPPTRAHARELVRARARAVKWGRAWVVEALKDAGMTGGEISRITGIPRRSVYDLVAKSARGCPIGMDTHSAPTLVERVTALEGEVAALRADTDARLADAERQLGLPPGGIKTAEEGLQRFLDSLEAERAA